MFPHPHLAQEFIEAIDAIDNGIAQYENAGAPRYSSRTDLSSRVGWLNPAWNESVEPKLVDVSVLSTFYLMKADAVYQSLFIKASELTGSEFLQRLQYYSKSWLPARDIVKDAFAARKNVHPSGSIIVFDRFAPWKVRQRYLCCSYRCLTFVSRNTSLTSREKWMSRNQNGRFTSSTQTRRAQIGGYRLSLFLRKALKVEERYRLLGEGCGTMCSLINVVYRAVYLCIVVASLVVRFQMDSVFRTSLSPLVSREFN